MSKSRRIVGIAVLAMWLFRIASFAQSARNYYNEIYQAGGLDRMADGFACFDDDPKLDTFFIFGKSETLKQFLVFTGDFKTMSKTKQAAFDRGFLILRGYDKGVAHPSEEIYKSNGTSWASEAGIVDGAKVRVLLSIEWTTLRYKRSVELLNQNDTLKSVPISRYGRCQNVSPNVQQKGN